MDDAPVPLHSHYLNPHSIPMSRTKKPKDSEASVAEEPIGENEELGEPGLEHALVLVEKLQDYGINAGTLDFAFAR